MWRFSLRRLDHILQLSRPSIAHLRALLLLRGAKPKINSEARNNREARNRGARSTGAGDGLI